MKIGDIIIGDNFDKYHEKLIKCLKDNEPLLLITSIVLVIAGLSKTEVLPGITDYAVSSATGFFMSLIGSILIKFNSKNLYLYAFFFSGLIVGFLFLIIIVYQFTNEMYLSSISFQMVILISTIIFGIIFANYSFKLSHSIIRGKNKDSVKLIKKLFSTLSTLLIISGLIIYVAFNSSNLFLYYVNKLECDLCLEWSSHGFLIFIIGLFTFSFFVDLKIGNKNLK